MGFEGAVYKSLMMFVGKSGMLSLFINSFLRNFFIVVAAAYRCIFLLLMTPYYCYLVFAVQS